MGRTRAHGANDLQPFRQGVTAIDSETSAPMILVRLLRWLVAEPPKNGAANLHTSDGTILAAAHQGSTFYDQESAGRATLYCAPPLTEIDRKRVEQGPGP